VGSVLLHAAVAGTLLFARPAHPATPPPVYRVQLLAAPPGPRAIGVVKPPETTKPPTPKPPPPRAQTRAREMPAPEPPKTTHRAPPREATPVETPRTTDTRNTEEDQAAGGGATGGRGADVATVRTEGIDFPYPGYLQNIVRQIALRFKPPGNTAASAEVFFLLHRDGSVSNLRFVQRSGNFAFDIEAQGAIESAARAGDFGPLPSGFADDVLPVSFSFDPKVLH
jgi:protein TonB